MSNALLMAEIALLARVEAAFPPSTLRTIEGLPGPLNAQMLAQYAPRAPGAFLSFLGARPARNGQDTWVDATWVVYVLTANAGGQVARRRGDAVQIGAYDMLPVIVRGICDTPFQGVGSATLERIENLWSGVIESRGYALYAATFVLPMEFTADSTESLGSFITFHADYDIEPLVGDAEHAKWLEEPPDLSITTPDASDTMTLEQ